MGDKRDRKQVKQPASAGQKAPTAVAPQNFIFTIQEKAGNQAVQRLLKGGLPFLISDPEFRRELRRQGVWRQYAELQLKPEQLQGLMTFQLPPDWGVSALESINPKRRSDEFVVASDKFGVTLTHPSSESQVRVVEKEHRYKPEEWTFETVHWPNETPAICYNLIKGEEGEVDQVLIATGPGAWVEISQPAPYEGAKETQLMDEWEHGLHPLRMGTFDVTIVEMPDNDLVPLPSENIDVQLLLSAGGKLRSPDRRIWRGAISYEEQVMAWGMIIAQLAMLAIPVVGEMVEAATIATEVGEAAADLGEAADAVADLLGETPAPKAPVTEPVVEPEPGAIPEAEATPIPGAAAEPATAATEQQLDGVVAELGGPRQGYTVQICDDSTFIETPDGGFSRPGLSARNAGGAETNTQTRTIWVHEYVVRNDGIVRSWGARLNLRQVVAHEMGHVESGEIQCSFASRAGADLPGLTEAERVGLMEDAARISAREGVPFNRLNFPPGFEPPE